MLTRIALVAPSGHAQKKIKGLLSRPLAYLVREFQTLDDIQVGLAQFHFQVLISRVPVFTPHHVAMVQKFASAFPTAGLVTISPQIEPQARFQLKTIFRHTLLDEELELGDLDRVIKRCSEEEVQTIARLHPRTKRDGHALLVIKNSDDSEIQVRARFLDFARMGARLVTDSESAFKLALNLKPKSRVELRYRSSENTERICRIETRVVWAEDASNPIEALMRKQKAEIGLRFIAEL